MHKISNLFYFGTTLHMFWTVCTFHLVTASKAATEPE